MPGRLAPSVLETTPHTDAWPAGHSSRCVSCHIQDRVSSGQDSSSRPRAHSDRESGTLETLLTSRCRQLYYILATEDTERASKGGTPHHGLNLAMAFGTSCVRSRITKANEGRSAAACGVQHLSCYTLGIGWLPAPAASSYQNLRIFNHPAPTLNAALPVPCHHV